MPFMNRRFLRDHAGFAILFAILLSMQAVAQSNPQANAAAGHERAVLQAVMKRVEAKYARPVKDSITHVEKHNFWETQAFAAPFRHEDMRVTRYGGLRRLLPTLRSAHPELIVYWIGSIENPNMERDKQTVLTPFKLEGTLGYKFAARIRELVLSSPALAPWADQLTSASNALLQEAVKAEHIKYGESEGEEKNALRRTLDIEGKRRDLFKVIQQMLGAAGELDPERNAAWKPLYQFLRQDIEQSWIASRDQLPSLRQTFWEACKAPAEATAHYEKLEAINSRLNGMKLQVIESALAPDQTPMSFLEGDVSEFINLEIAFDRELLSALDSPALQADPGLIGCFYGLYSVWESLERYQDYLNSSLWAYSLRLLRQIAVAGQLDEHWIGYEFDPETGKSISEFVVQRAGQTVDSLNKYRETWLEHNAPDGSLYAAVQVDEQGHRVWTHYSWILWKWITNNDLDDLKVDGRVVEGMGRRWLLPANSSVKSIGSLRDVRAADARELIIALDPAGAWAGRRKAAK